SSAIDNLPEDKVLSTMSSEKPSRIKETGASATPGNGGMPTMAVHIAPNRPPRQVFSDRSHSSMLRDDAKELHLMSGAAVATAEDLLAELAGWVKLETPSTDAAAVNRLMDVAHHDLVAAGAELTRVPGKDGFGDALVARTPGRGEVILVIGHLDTVWP